MKLKNVSIFAIIFMLMNIVSALANEEYIDFESDQWILKNAEINDHLGRKSLCGTAELKDVEFTNGIIEVDIAVTGERSYPGVNFRIRKGDNAEHFYIRPHRAGLYPDAIQYAPIFNGISGWQLYNGDGFTNGGQFPENEWVHVKMEVAGKQARVFINDALVLEIHDLKHGVSRGTIGVSGPKNNSAYFSNFRYKIDDSLQLPLPPKREVPPGIITDWEISRSFRITDLDAEKHPAQQNPGDLSWQRVKAEPNGLVDVGRFYRRTGREADAIFARTQIYADKAEKRKIMFGYSDGITIFLNGEILFLGNNAYQQRDPSFLGIIGLNDAVFLPLKKGENELLIMVAESFGGWGFMFQDGTTIYQASQIAKKWETERIFLIPESAAYDAKRKVVYISNYDWYRHSPAETGQYISKIGLNGTMQNLKWITGIQQPTGMTVYQDKLLVVCRRNLVEIDLEQEKVVAEYAFPQPGFPNDITIDQKGTVYISDSQKKLVYMFKNKSVSVWLKDDQIEQPNGVCILKDELIISNNAEGALKAINLKTQKIRTLANVGNNGGIDGIEIADSGNLLVSHYQGRVFRVTPEGVVTKLIDSTVPENYCADFEYIPEKKLLVIPTLWNNRVVAYEVGE